MKKTTGIFLVIGIFCVGFLGYVAYKIFPGIKPVITRPAQDIVDSIEKQNDLPPGENLTDFPLTMPDGFTISVFAKNLPGARVLAMDSFGNLWVSRKQAGVVTLLDVENGQVVAQKDVIVGLKNPHGIVFDPHAPGNLYVAEEDGISRFEVYREAEIFVDMDDITRVENTLVTSAYSGSKVVALPAGGRHTTRTLIFGADGRLYVSIGSTCDVCVEKDSRIATVMVVNEEQKKLEPFATGLRNAVFLATNPVDGQLWATEMGRDRLGDELPPDEINILQAGRNYGWPYCYGKQILDTQFENNEKSSDRCRSSIASQVDLPAHSAPLGLAFVPEEGWPEEYRLDLLVAYHGSWNRSKPTGYKISRIKLDQQGNFQGEEDFISGWLTKDGRALGRPVDLLALPGGNLYVSDDKSGVIYKISVRSDVNVSNFAECVAAGYPVMESYPRQCREPGGQLFVEPVTTDVSDLIRVSVPTVGTEIKNPVVIEGEARGTWFFEGSFPVLLLGESGQTLATGIASTQGEWMTEEFVPFRAVLNFDTPKNNFRGTLILKKDNPSGLPENDKELRISVRLPTMNQTTANSCFVTGCSNQVCADEQTVTDCTFREEYICYQKASCERQPDGRCDWTETTELIQCLSQFE